MHLNDYQSYARTTAVYPEERALEYLTLKLTGEAGEVAEKVGKHFRGDYDRKELRKVIGAELGDVLWYVAGLADEFGLTLEDVAYMNITKLRDRQRRKTLQGDGDVR